MGQLVHSFSGSGDELKVTCSLLTSQYFDYRVKGEYGVKTELCS